MIEDLEWRSFGNTWVLYAYDGHMWFMVPFTIKKHIEKEAFDKYSNPKTWAENQ